MNSTNFSLHLGTHAEPVFAALDEMAKSRLVGRIWDRDHRVWKSEPAEIANRLGWLTVADQMVRESAALATFAAAVRKEGVRDVVLLGMGGSSLGPEVLRCTLGRYVALLAYTTPSRQVDAAIQSLRKQGLLARRLPTTAGYGPRYLHSTGQLHKGGPNSGLFVELVEDMKPDLAIPDQPFSFGTLAQAQAVGDYQSLQAHGRVVVRIAVGRRPDQAIRALAASPARSRPTPKRRARPASRPARNKRPRR
jgi:hypothetical protein